MAMLGIGYRGRGEGEPSGSYYDVAPTSSRYSRCLIKFRTPNLIVPLAIASVFVWWRRWQSNGKSTKVRFTPSVSDMIESDLTSLQAQLDRLKKEFGAAILLTILPTAVIMFGAAFALGNQGGRFSLSAARQALLDDPGVNASGAVAVNLAATAVIATLAVALAVGNQTTIVQPHRVFWTSVATTINRMLAALSLLACGLSVLYASSTHAWSGAVISASIALLNTALAAATLAWEGKDHVELLDKRRTLQRSRSVGCKYSTGDGVAPTKRILIFLCAVGTLQTVLVWMVTDGDRSWVKAVVGTVVLAVTFGVLTGIHLAGLLFAIRIEFDPDWASRAGIVTLFLLAEAILMLGGLQFLPPSDQSDWMGILIVGFQGLLPPVAVGLGLLGAWPGFVAALQSKRSSVIAKNTEREIEQLRTRIHVRVDLNSPWGESSTSTDI